MMEHECFLKAQPISIKLLSFKLTESQNELFFHMRRLLTKTDFMDLKSEESIKEKSRFHNES